MFGLKKLFSGEAGSKNAAKERLRLVLIHDRASVSQETIESMKRELIDVISHYIEFDTNDLEFKMESKNEKVALIASIPIVSNKKSIKGA